MTVAQAHFNEYNLEFKIARKLAFPGPKRERGMLCVVFLPVTSLPYIGNNGSNCKLPIRLR